jgi:hypothetical protein
MRVLWLALLAAAPAAADEVLLREARAWRGSVEVRARSVEPEGATEFREEHVERVDFLVVTEPKASPGPPRPLGFVPREMEGSWSVRIHDRDEHVTRASGEGPLRPRVTGEVDPVSGRCRLDVQVTPARFIVPATMAGMVEGRPQTFRTVAGRGSFLAEFTAEGTLEDGRRLAGARTFEDRRAKHPRAVTIEWRLERIDPVVAGRVTDHRGRPLAGLAVVATTTNAERLRRRLPPLRLEAVTGEDGTFAIDAFHAPWRVEVMGARRGAELIEGGELDAEVRLDHAPALEVELAVYRLEALPWRRLFHEYFQEDGKRYLAYVRERVSERELRAALAPE